MNNYISSQFFHKNEKYFLIYMIIISFIKNFIFNNILFNLIKYYMKNIK